MNLKMQKHSAKNLMKGREQARVTKRKPVLTGAGFPVPGVKTAGRRAAREVAGQRIHERAI